MLNKEVGNIKKSTPKSRIERRKERTEKKIISAAIKLFDQNGIEETTMEEIAEKADVARGTLYNYFSSKEEIISKYIEQSIKTGKAISFQELQEMPDTRTRMTYIFNQLVKGIQHKKDLFEKHLIYRMQNMLSFQQIESEKSSFSLLGYKLIELGQNDGEIRNDIPLYILEDLFEFSFVEAVKPLYMEVDNFDSDKAIERSIDVFINGVKPDS